MDWNSILQRFVELVSVARLEGLGVLLILTVLGGIGGAIKSKAFSWAKLASFLQPSGTFLGYTIGYIVIAGLAGAFFPDWLDPATVVTSYTFLVVSMAAKLKEQYTFLWPSFPVLNWKLPFEQKSGG